MQFSDISLIASCGWQKETVRVSDNAVFEEINETAGREFGINAYPRTGKSFGFFGVVPEGDSPRFKLAEGERMVARGHLLQAVSRQHRSAALKEGVAGAGIISSLMIGAVAYALVSPFSKPDSNDSTNWVEGSLKLGGIGAAVGRVSGLAIGPIAREVNWFNENP